MAYRAADEAYIKAAKSWNPGGMLHKAMIKDIAQRQAKLWDKTYRDSLRFLGTEGMLVPKDKRGMIAPSSVIIDSHLRIKADKPRKLSPNIRKGLDLVTSIVPADKLPSGLGLQIVKNNSLRAFQLDGNIKISDQHAPSVVAHELAHAIEFSNPDVLRKSAAFLYDRGEGMPANPYPNLNRELNTNPWKKPWKTNGRNGEDGLILAKFT